MVTRDQLWKTLDKWIYTNESYGETLDKLSSTLPIGYSLCYAFHYVDAEILNGGINQLYGNPTWSLILTAIKACQQAKVVEIDRLLREVVLYYYQRGRSRLKRQITENFFEGIDLPMEKSLSQLEDEYYARGEETEKVVTTLLDDESLWK